mmetsp:Transcript_5852/g.13564  ORF Transcript_5852/g.13564 Transcript_5852/m.13564 type:complete len:484 (+) Transcript_5852:90-1541(+)
MPGTYRATGSGQDVDDSLFGKPTKKRGNRDAAANAVVISRSELNNIKGRAIVRSAADEKAESAAKEAAMERKQAAAKARQERMLKKEEDAKKKAKKSEMEIMKETREATIRELAEKQVDENLDLVKMLNTLGARAAAFTIRDKQLAEKDGREQIEQNYNQRMDMLMEVDRLKELQQREQTEEARRVKRLDDRSVIVEQMRGREKYKMMVEEEREQENQAMLALMKRYQDEDQASAEKRAVEVKRSREEVMAANAQAIKRKELAKLQDKQEEESILAYQAKKDADIAQREFEEAEKARMAKERQAKLLAMQEKSQNKQAELDELRARRHQEEKERRERGRERAEAELKKSRMAEMAVARTQQAAQRKAMMAREAVMQQQEYEEAVRHAMVQMERESKEASSKTEAAKIHREALQAQINSAEDYRKRHMNDKFEEGRRLKQEFASERAKLETIRDKMVSDMQAKGVNPKYLTEMKSADIQKMQMR